MRIASSQVQGVPLLRVIGDVDHATAPRLRESITLALAEGSSCILLDLESCPYLDSGGVGVLMETLRQLRPEGWLGVVAPSLHVHRILALVGFSVDPGFRIFSSLDEAQTALRNELSFRSDPGTADRSQTQDGQEI